MFDAEDEVTGKPAEAEFDQLAIELAASLKLYLQLAEIHRFSPEVRRLMSDLAREILISAEQDGPWLQ
ncbi:MAG: hypothetical protein ABW076_10125 [Candidatus Thiodiazotropha sp.]